VRFNCPIYTFESILSGAGTLLTEGLDEVLDEQSTRSNTEGPISTLASHSIEELEEKLEEALDNEDYELASRIRDELNRRK
jgi:excinuclease UvrABC helicase subunit UvrB